VDDVEIGDDFEGDGSGDGAPDGSGSDGNASGPADESVARFPDSQDTDADVADFSKQAATIGGTNDAASAVGSMPVAFRLLGASPNPFNPKTTIRFELTESQEVDLKIYDVSGRLVRDLLHGVTMPPGRHGVEWNGRDEVGRMSSAGIYLYRFDAGGDSETERMTLVR